MHTKFDTNRSRNGRDIPVYVFPIWRPSAILDFKKSHFFGHIDPCMANIYLHTKFGAKGQEMAEIYLFMYFLYGGRPPSWILGKVTFLAIVTLVWPMSICIPNLVQIGQAMAEIYRFMYFQDSGRLPSWIWYCPILDHPCRRSRCPSECYQI